MEEKKLSQEQVWNSIAEKWNEYMEKPLSEVLDFLKNKKGKLLDLGCGSGRHFIEFNGTIYGVDFSEKLLSLALKKSESIDKKIILIKSSADKLQFKDNFFDCAIFIRALHCIDSENARRRSVKELHRVLKPEARAFIQTWGKNNSRLKTKDKECFIPWTVNGKKYLRHTYIFDKEELEKMLKKSGFVVEKIWEDRNINVIVKK